MFKWPQLPSPRAPAYEIADFAELICWRDAGTSMEEIASILGRLEENDYSEGVPEQDDIDDAIEEAYMEIENRLESCQGGYPFHIGDNGTTLKATRKLHNSRQIIYKYLLLATRLNMQSNRIHARIDGTRLLEYLAAEVAQEYFGERAESLVFGTADEDSNFERKVDELCRRLGEGGGFQRKRARRGTRAKDGKLDIVVWTPFADKLPGKLIGFGQCKTGTNYNDELTELRPDVFREKWLSSALIVPPVRLFFISEALAFSDECRFEISIEAGLTFDRCRIIDFCNNIPSRLLASLESWTTEAARETGLPTNW